MSQFMEHMKKKKKTELRFFFHAGLVTLVLIYFIIYLLFKITEQCFVENSAYEQFSLIGSCYTGACNHKAIICVLLAHQRLL